MTIGWTTSYSEVADLALRLRGSLSKLGQNHLHTLQVLACQACPPAVAQFNALYGSRCRSIRPNLYSTLRVFGAQCCCPIWAAGIVFVLSLPSLNDVGV